MDEKKKIVDAVYDLFHDKGAKIVTMDDVSKACRISKKTLYKFFPTKEFLLKAIVDKTIDGIKQILAQTTNQKLNAIDELFFIHENVYQFLKSEDEVFIYQLKKYYPIIHNDCTEACNSIFYVFLINNLEKGITEGLYTKNSDLELYAKLFISMHLDTKINDTFRSTIYTQKQLSKIIIKFYLNAITTLKGNQYLIQIQDNESI